ncbi:MAG: CDP-alcohol phosphatidyltransferase family protein [Desulfobacteraceae bacterium]|nr:CDP-alcohol phosphatidyltransferase family protein [Desulfobacteraceae bacterium]
MRSYPYRFLHYCVVSCLMDLFDGPLARKMGQCSKFGEILDVLTDTIWPWAKNMTGGMTHTRVFENGHSKGFLLECINCPRDK